MASVTTKSGVVFRVETDRHDVTSRQRPDTGWRFTDAQGHEHHWYADGVPATGYNPSAQHTTPTLKWVKDGTAYWPDADEPHDVGHHECIDCGERIEPRYTADMTNQFVPGLRRCYIDDKPVSAEEFERRMREVQGYKNRRTG